jgi:hypothetical protein
MCNLYSHTKSPKAMLLHRVRAAAAEKSDAFDVMLSDLDVNRLFNDGAILIRRLLVNLRSVETRMAAVVLPECAIDETHSVNRNGDVTNDGGGGLPSVHR